MSRTRAQKSETRLTELAASLSAKLDAAACFTSDLTPVEVAELLRRSLHDCNMVVRINPRSPRGKRGKEQRQIRESRL